MQRTVQVVVLAAVSAVEMLPVLAMVQLLVVVEGDTRPSPAASDGCPLGMMLLTVVATAEQVAVQGAVQVAGQMAVQVAGPAPVLSAVQVVGLSVLMVGTSPSPRASDA
ncbi:hypothetical protein NDU88_003324 [Pleurodeles waltl]|uniref:Secreted protein n=1 Tax=Pleurodeles waltl TaxID=8319 RepID=A0AAV7QFD5_PLEWA|nr:hypothetical protein NDU88_003324 [Pleurodeles waltl]